MPSDDPHDFEAVATARREAAQRRWTRAVPSYEVRMLVDDPVDREEMRLVSEQMAELAPRARDDRSGHTARGGSR